MRIQLITLFMVSVGLNIQSAVEPPIAKLQSVESIDEKLVTPVALNEVPVPPSEVDRFFVKSTKSDNTENQSANSSDILDEEEDKEAMQKDATLVTLSAIFVGFLILIVIPLMTVAVVRNNYGAKNNGKGKPFCLIC